MKLIEVEIFNFKSIKHENVEINSNQLCFVGVNESGKSSIIEAISYLNISKKLTSNLLNKEDHNYPKGLPFISGIFEINKHSDKSIYDLLYEFLNVEHGILRHYEKLYLQIKRWGNGFGALSLEISNNDNLHWDLLNLLKDKNQRAEFLDKFFQNYPIIELYEKEDLLIEPASPDELQGYDEKFETFRRLLYVGGCREISLLDTDDDNFLATFLNGVARKFNGILKKHYKQDINISITLTVGRNNKLVLIINDGTEKGFTIQERSPGFQYYFAFIINKLYYNEIYHAKNVIFLLDEPGPNLHPKGAKDLLKTFREISSKNLLLYTTHNPFLTLRNNLDGLIHVQKDVIHGTKINKKPWVKKYHVLRKELGILLNDSFLIGDVNLLVEGATEKFALPIIFELKKLENLEWLNIYNVDGVTNMTQTLSFLGPNNLNQSGIVLLDSDDEAKYEKDKPAFKKMMTEKNWDLIEINDIFSDDGIPRTFEDLFPQDLYIRAFNCYCNSIKDIGVFDKEYENFNEKSGPLPIPIIKTLTGHFFSFINEERKKRQSITKQDVVRELIELLLAETEDKRNKALEKVFLLADVINQKSKKIETYVNNETQNV